MMRCSRYIDVAMTWASMNWKGETKERLRITISRGPMDGPVTYIRRYMELAHLVPASRVPRDSLAGVGEGRARKALAACPLHIFSKLEPPAGKASF
jgi:hypothetical protein